MSAKKIFKMIGYKYCEQESDKEGYSKISYITEKLPSGIHYIVFYIDTKKRKITFMRFRRTPEFNPMQPYEVSYEELQAINEQIFELMIRFFPQGIC